MSSKEDIDSNKESNFTIDGNMFENIKEGSSQDFNIRYHDKTYFSIKYSKVKGIKSLNVSSNHTGEILLVLREK